MRFFGWRWHFLSRIGGCDVYKGRLFHVSCCPHLLSGGWGHLHIGTMFRLRRCGVCDFADVSAAGRTISSDGWGMCPHLRASLWQWAPPVLTCQPSTHGVGGGASWALPGLNWRSGMACISISLFIEDTHSCGGCLLCLITLIFKIFTTLRYLPSSPFDTCYL